MKKRFPVVFLLLVLICGILVPFAAAADNFTVEFWVGKKYFEVDGNRNTMDAAPVIKSGRTLLPLRYAANAVNVTNNDISWDSKTKKATVKKGESTVVFTAGSKNMLKDNKTTRMDIAPVITGGRILLPLRYVANALGVNCEYVAMSKKIILSDGPIDTGVINMTAAKNGTLAPPANAVSPATDDGFSPAINSLLCTVGSKYAKVDGVTKIDLGTQVVVVDTDGEGIDWYIKTYPKLYNKNNCLIDSKVTRKDGSAASVCYVPFIPVAKAWGVPETNMVWDGKHLAIFGYYGNRENYYILTAGSREIIARYGNSRNGKTGDPVVVSGKLNYPLYVRNGVPMMGIETVSDFQNILFKPPGSVGLVDSGAYGGFNYETGIMEMD